MTPDVALAIGAHPDDIELFAGGTLAAWSDSGSRITFVILTDGRLGSPDPSDDPGEVAASRAREAREAAGRFGAHVELLGYPDGGLEPHRAAATEALVRIIRDRRPDVVLAHDPWRLYELHADHRAAGLAACDAVIAAREHHAFPGTGDAHRAGQLWLAGTTQPDHHVDIADTVERKIAALACHRSQFGHVAGWEDRVRAWNAAIGAERGYRSAEAFRLIELPAHTAMMAP